MIVFDFETEGINGNPTVRPPKPVGLAYKKQGKKPRYLSWGHPSGNREGDRDRAIAILKDAKASGEEVLFHNGKFDMSVAEAHLGVTFNPDPLRIHDTLYQIFLYDPYAESFSLKPSAERILGWAPEERDAVRDWVLAHIDCPPSEWGAHIADAPAEIVGPYAIGDVTRTLALHEHLRSKVPDEAYAREQKLRPIIVASERMGIRCDLERLEKDLAVYEKTLLRADDECRRILNAPDCNLDSGEELANAIEAAGFNNGWIRTPTGRRSTARDAILAVLTHPTLAGLLAYRGALSHCLASFGRPWMHLARDYGGRLHPEWNQVRQNRDMVKDPKGTRTGRLSGMKPSFMNVPNDYERVTIPKKYPPLPLMRQYLLPDKGMVWIKRDYSQQELRILAHYSEGRLYQRYQDNPRIDAHEETQKLIREYANRDLPRKAVKIVGFSIIYGSGVPHLASQLGVPFGEGMATREAYFAALPEVPVLMKDCVNMGRSGQPITTWGGRKYLTEPAKIVTKGKFKGRHMTFEYKLLNYLIQGSAADCTKEAIIRWGQDMGTGQFLCTVHDEIDGQAPKGSWKKDMDRMRKAMESIEFDVKMLSDGFMGPNWATLEACK